MKGEETRSPRERLACCNRRQTIFCSEVVKSAEGISSVPTVAGRTARRHTGTPSEAAITRCLQGY